jgi:hypothetical protein
MENELRALEDRIGQLAALARRLRAENAELRQSLLAAQGRRKCWRRKSRAHRYGCSACSNGCPRMPHERGQDRRLGEHGRDHHGPPRKRVTPTSARNCSMPSLTSIGRCADHDSSKQGNAERVAG